MKRFSKLTAIAAISFASLALVANAADKMSDSAAETLMKANGAAIGTLSKMAKGELAFDAATAEAAKQALITNMAGLGDAFKMPFEEADASALPAVWENMDDFLAKGKALTDAATALDVTSKDTIGAGLGAVGGACGGCHEVYRAKS